MSTLLIGYDLDRPAQNYANLEAAIKAIGDWWHHLDSTWLVVTPHTPTQVRDALAKHIDSRYDKLLVIDISRDAAAWIGFNDQGAKWLKAAIER